MNLLKSDKTLPIFSQSWLYTIGIFLIGLTLYFSILSIGIPDKLVFRLLTSDPTILSFVILSLLYFAYRPSGWLGTLTSFTATLTLFATQLSGFWRSGINLTAYMMSGLLTMTDTTDYYNSALKLLEGGTFGAVSSWRPLAHGVLATLLGLTQQNLQLTIALLVLMVAITSFILAREIQQTQGTGPAVVLIVIIFLYYRVYLGTPSTEGWGVILGMVALASLWRGVCNSQSQLYLLGIFLLTLALNTRAGAFFVLPGLILWGSWFFRRNARFSSSLILGGFSLVFLGFVVNSIVFKLVAAPNATSFSNFSYSLYGLLVGGNWLTVFSQHPGLGDMNDPETGQKVYQLVWEILRSDPFSLVRGIFRAWKMFFWDDFVFDFIPGAELNKLNIILQILTVIGVVKLYRQRNTPLASMVLVVSLGIFFSIPFIPPWDAGMRPYMATVPMIALLPTFGVSAIVEKMSWQPLLKIPQKQEPASILWIGGLMFALLTFGGVTSTKLLSNSPQLPQSSCPIDQETIYFRHSQGSMIHLVPDRGRQQTNLPNIQLSTFNRALRHYEKEYGHHSGVPQLKEELSQLPANTTIINKINLQNGKTNWIIVPDSLMPKSQEIVTACGQFSPLATDTTQNGYLKFVFYVDSIQENQS
ncbi:hypothetical protein [Crocosphaera sp.]|uniref:hypothetical protein n=1 Tax=Crocosphaera sp. TaxID=2729996 RepID=UPI00260B9967|nr:hypothetical protein [Crocosphaera sp.]MDJ0579449.1 hypothetical protein [Crocosphaera sp.]